MRATITVQPVHDTSALPIARGRVQGSVRVGRHQIWISRRHCRRRPDESPLRRDRIGKLVAPPDSRADRGHSDDADDGQPRHRLSARQMINIPPWSSHTGTVNNRVGAHRLGSPRLSGQQLSERVREVAGTQVEIDMAGRQCHPQQRCQQHLHNRGRLGFEDSSPVSRASVSAHDKNRLRPATRPCSAATSSGWRRDSSVEVTRNAAPDRSSDRGCRYTRSTLSCRGSTPSGNPAAERCSESVVQQEHRWP